MKDNFVTYDQALALKDLGFIEPCFAYYGMDNIEDKIFFDIDPDDGELTSLNQNQFFYSNLSVFGRVSAPLKQQAILFLLNKCDEDGTDTRIEYFGDESGDIDRNLGFGTLYDAIQILIEIVKNK